MLFFRPEKCVSANWDDGLLENIYETMEENGIHQPEDQFPPARISSVFKNWFSRITVTASRKKLSSKVTFSIRQKHPSPIAGMKDSFKNTFLLDIKKSFPRQESLKNYKKWFVIVRKSVYTSRNEAFVEKYISTIRKNCFFWQENQKMVSTRRKMFFF